MSHELDPKVGRWYRQIDEDELFKVVSIDEDDDLIEIRYVDGDLEELDSAAWIELDLERAEEPEDWRDPDDDEDDDDEDDLEEPSGDDEEDRGATRRPPKRPREDWDEDEDEDDWDEDEDEDDDDFDR